MIKKYVKFMFDAYKLVYLFFKSKYQISSVKRAKTQFISGIKSPDDYKKLTYEIAVLMDTDLYLRWYMGANSRESYWHRAVEYSQLLNIFDSFKELEGKKILDIGTGNCTYPVFFLKNGAEVISIDVTVPMGKRLPWCIYKQNKYGLKRTVGDMLKMLFKDNSFDIVTSISVIEHVNEKFVEEKWEPVNGEDFLERTQTCLKEMIRVLKPGGILYITSDVFKPREEEIPCLSNLKENRNRAAYQIHEIQNFWLPIIEEMDVDLLNPRPFTKECYQQILNLESSISDSHKRPFIILGKKR